MILPLFSPMNENILTDMKIFSTIMAEKNKREIQNIELRGLQSMILCTSSCNVTFHISVLLFVDVNVS